MHIFSLDIFSPSFSLSSLWAIQTVVAGVWVGEGFPWGRHRGKKGSAFNGPVCPLRLQKKLPFLCLIPYLCISIVRLFLSLAFSACSSDPPVSLSDIIRWLRLVSFCLRWRVRIVQGEKERRCPSGDILKYQYVFSQTPCLTLNRCWCQWKLWRWGGPLNSFWTHAEMLMFR